MHLLVISEGFAPWGGPSAIRATKVAREALAAGWSVTVLCQTTNCAHVFDDPALCEGLDGLRFLRVSNGTDHRLRSVAARIGGVVPRVLDRLLRKNHERWAGDMAEVGLRELAADVPDVVFCTAPPPPILRVGLTLAREFRVPLVADLRDVPWGSKAAARQDDFAEAVELAALVVMNTPAAASEATRRFPHAAGRIECWTNAVDEVAGEPPPPLSEELARRLVYAGGLYVWAFEGIQKWAPLVQERVVEVWAYVFPETKHRQRIAALREAGVQVKDAVPSREVPKIMRSSAGTFCYMSPQHTASKAFLGIASGRPLFVYESDYDDQVGGADRELLTLPGVYAYRSGSSTDDIHALWKRAKQYDSLSGWTRRREWLAGKTWRALFHGVFDRFLPCGRSESGSNGVVR